MGSFANTLFTILLGWLRGAVSAVWTAFTSEQGNTFLTWIGNHWIPIALILCVIGLAADLCVYLLRWKPFKVWQSFLFRNRVREEADDEPEEKPVPARKTAERPRRVIVHDNPARETEQEKPDFSQWQEETETAAVRYPEAAERRPATVTGAGYVVPADSPYRRPSGPEASSYGKAAEWETGPRRRRTEAAEPIRNRQTEPEESSRHMPAETDDRVYRRPAEKEENSYNPTDEQESRSRRTEQAVIRTPVSREYIAPEDYPETGRAKEEPAPVVFRKRRRISVTDLFADPEEELKQIDAPQDIIDRNKAYREPVYPRGWKRNEDNEG